MKNRGRRYASTGSLIKSRARSEVERATTGGPGHAPPARPMLRLVRPDEPPLPESASARRHRFERVLRIGLVIAATMAAVALVWWSVTADERALRALPEAQRVPLLQSTIANLKNVCDPAPPLSMREFCRRQAELAIKFRECTRDADCQQLARRHLYQPHR